MKKILTAAALAFLPGLASAAGLNGSELSLWWALPFAGILLSIALCPLIVPNFWHHHFGKVAVFWALCTAVPLFVLYDASTATSALAHAVIGDYLPFIIFVGVLFVVAGGIHIRSSFLGTPIVNVIMLFIGAMLANVMGTTGAAMLLIRPLLEANKTRKYQMHTFIFFIFLVANIGGCLTPLGDPPLFMGFLRGVHFFWTTEHLFIPMITTVLFLLAIYFVIDTVVYKKEDQQAIHNIEKVPFKIEGGINILLLLCVVGSMLISGFWKSGISFNILGVDMALEAILRDVLFVIIGIVSLAATPKVARDGNQFSWDPILEVGKLFFGIFCCIVPVLEMLRAGHSGAFAPLVAMVTNADGTFNNHMFFWMAGSLSSFLDNTPTYLAFFNLAGGDPQLLMNEDAHTLMAISMGSVFMGSMTYIGNAPNFMTISIVQERGIKMPSFFGYMIWSCGILIPTFLLLNQFFI
ncbi:MAG TPA: sodium:proton antiporter [Candidatus Aphodousia gallistercoris]|nr:sodium:proton antiporter [Candidatus Aphodousia gallistercoris]